MADTLEAQRNAFLRLSRDILKKRCKNAKLSAEGSKGDLVTRLLQSQSAQPPQRAQNENLQSSVAVVSVPGSRHIVRNNGEGERRAAEAERERQRVQKRAQLQKRLRYNARARIKLTVKKAKQAKLQSFQPLELVFAGLSPPKTYQNTTDHSDAVASLGNYGCVMLVRTALTVKSSIGDLKQFIRGVYGVDSRRGLMIFHSHLQISHNDSAKLFHFGITNRSLLTILVAAKTSYTLVSDPSTSYKILARAIQDMQALRMQTCRGLDIVTQETDVELYRMPVCGHLMSRQSLYYYALSAFSDQATLHLRCPHATTPNTAEAPAGRHARGLNRNRFKWRCMQCTSANVGTKLCRTCRAPQPKHATAEQRASNQCNAEWHFSLIKQILYSPPAPADDNVGVESKTEENDMDDHDDHLNVAKLELLSARNTLQSVHNEKRRGIQKCFKCSTLHFLSQARRKDAAPNRTECVLCQSCFCWNCGDQYSAKHRCDDQHVLSLVGILQKCDTKTIGYVHGAPSIRACPNTQCGQLITHVTACKHMKCRSCKLNFCFVCMKPMLRGNWQCGDSSDVCPIAPRQTLKSMKLEQTAKPPKQFQFW